MTPERWQRLKEVTWFQDIQAEVTTAVDQLLEENEQLRSGGTNLPRLVTLAEVAALLPKCGFRADCKKVGVKWIARTHLHCDDHGSQYDLDAPWAEFARKHGL